MQVPATSVAQCLQKIIKKTALNHIQITFTFGCYMSNTCKTGKARTLKDILFYETGYLYVLVYFIFQCSNGRTCEELHIFINTNYYNIDGWTCGPKTMICEGKQGPDLGLSCLQYILFFCARWAQTILYILVTLKLFYIETARHQDHQSRY